MASNSYTLRFKNSAAKEFRGLSKELRQRVGEAIDRLSLNPRPEGMVKLQGSDNLYRIRIGDYRVVYTIDGKEKVILIMRVRHRRDVYQN